MDLTKSAIIFKPPNMPRTLVRSRFSIFLGLSRSVLSIFGVRSLFAPLRHTETFKLARITHFRPRSLEFGVTFQIGVDGWSFQLLTTSWPLGFAPAAAASEHQQAVVQAWEHAQRT
jgi:hypothetical protein